MEETWEQLDGCWRRKSDLSDGVTAFVMKSDRFFEDTTTNTLVDDFFQSLEPRIIAALRAAISSSYVEDIAQCGGINLNCVQWQGAGTYQIWFSLGFHPDRMLAVKFAGDAPSDVYCDPP